MNSDQYGKNSMQAFSLARSLEQCEFGFGTPGLTLYPDANTLFDVEANNDFCNFLNHAQLSLLFEVWFYALHCHINLSHGFHVVPNTVDQVDRSSRSYFRLLSRE